VTVDAYNAAAATITPPAFGLCEPAFYEISYAVAGSLPSTLVTLPPGALTATPFAWLWNGMKYEATAAGVCANGQRTPASAAVQFAAAGLPAAPPTPQASYQGGGSAAITWGRPSSDGGSEILGYHMSCVDVLLGGGTLRQTVMGAYVYAASFSGLTQPAAYSCTVAAFNRLGSSLPSAPSSVFATVPPTQAPTSVAVTGKSSSAFTLTWAVPGSAGWVDGYKATCAGAATVGPRTYLGATTATTGTLGFTGLAAGTQYSCTVVAFNSAGSGPASSPPATDTTNGACFPADTLVVLPSGARRRMGDLTVGDQVLSVDAAGALTWSPVFAFPHFITDGTFFPFKRIRTANATLTLSDDHYVLLANPRVRGLWSARTAVPARQVQVGDSMWVASAAGQGCEVARVVAVDDVLAQGLVAPFTMTGTLVAGGVVASSYTDMFGSEARMHAYAWRGRRVWRHAPWALRAFHACKWASPWMLGVADRYRAVLRLLGTPMS
jgi:hypothetical protein